MRFFYLILVFLSIGCAPITQRQPNPEDFQRSLSLIDQGVEKLRMKDFDSARANFQVAWELNPSAAALDGIGCSHFGPGTAKASAAILSKSN